MIIYFLFPFQEGLFCLETTLVPELLNKAVAKLQIILHYKMCTVCDQTPVTFIDTICQ